MNETNIRFNIIITISTSFIILRTFFSIHFLQYLTYLLFECNALNKGLQILDDKSFSQKSYEINVIDYI